jgi:N-methylhydantoinase B
LPQPIEAVDPVTVSVLEELLVSVVREMRVTFSRSAFSSIINEGHDFSCALLSAEGELVALSEDNPGHIFPLSYAAREIFSRYAGDIHPDDIFILNDPYICGTHMNDVAIFCPRFQDGRGLIFPAIRAHWGDVGGSVAGSLSGDSSHIFMEGTIIPPLRLYSRGELNKECLEMILANMRGRRDRHGDLMAMLGTCRLATRRIVDFENRYGADTVQAASEILLGRSEGRIRQSIEKVPDGNYYYENYTDNSGTGTEPLRISLRLEVAGDRVHCDFSGTSDQVNGPMNAGPATAATSCFMVLKSVLDPGASVNAGCFRPLSVAAPEGSILNAQFPAPFGGASDLRRTVEATVLGAVIQAIPGFSAGDTKGCANHCYISGRHPESGEAFLYYEYPAGGTGAVEGSDGDHFLRTYTEGDFNSIQPVESLEGTLPVLFERSDLRPGSCGHGQWRGGLGLERRIRVEAEGAALTVLTDRVMIPPYGVETGGASKGNRFIVIRDGEELELSEVPGKATAFELLRGDVVVLRSAGGGGLGDPLARDPDAVLEDVRLGYIAGDEAASEYGVVISDGKIDEKSTASKRSRIKDARVYMKTRPTAEDEFAGVRRLCRISGEAARRFGFRDGQLIEYVPQRAAPLRAWVKISDKIAEDETPIGPIGMSILSLSDGDPIRIRPVRSPYAHPPL